MINTVSGWFTPKKEVTTAESVVVPEIEEMTDSVAEQPLDSLQILFDTPRVYTEFIASERITSGSRLALISKRYFGHRDFWVYIYEANKERIPNPNEVAIGTLIRIPKIDARLIDANNPRCIEKAKELHDLYVK